MADNTSPISLDTLFTWGTRILMGVLTFLGAQIYSSFNEVKADVKTLLKENEVTKTEVKLMQKEIDKYLK